MGSDVLGFDAIGRTDGAIVGGKAANLGELARIEGVCVPRGFCVTTSAFERVVLPVVEENVSRLNAHERETMRALSAEIRRNIEEMPMPSDFVAAIADQLASVGENAAYAVRSSATAEDLPTASFAGQHETYLNVVGSAAILRSIRRCWASLFSERAVIYRLRNGVDHRRLRMAVVVQRMIEPDAAGVLFTADPVSGHRKVAAVEATFGLGEALLSGRVSADVYSVRDDVVVAKTIATKRLAIRAAPGGGTTEQAIELARRQEPTLTDAQVVELVRLGRRIEAHFGCPQDIEWCRSGERFDIVQSRPITTLFPIPKADDDENRVYVSVGHQQMMTDAMKPLGISLRLLMSVPGMREAGGRIFVDVTRRLASPATRAGLLAALGKSDPLIRDALETVVARGVFLGSPSEQMPAPKSAIAAFDAIDADPTLVAELMRRSEDSIATVKRDIRGQSGSALLDFILADIDELKRILFDPQSTQVYMTAMEASGWLNDRLQAWLGEKNAADALTQSVPNNVTSEMGLALLDVADAIRPHAEVVAFLQRVESGSFLDELLQFAGGREAHDAIRAWLERYGMRCVGEVDITRPRWSESPIALAPLILGNVKNFAPGESARRFERGRQDASKKEQDLLTRLRALPNGEQKAQETKRMIDRLRTFIGYREYPKYGMVSRYFVYKQALMEEAARLVRAQVLSDSDDIFFLTLEELSDVARTHRVDDALIRQRKRAFEWQQSLAPPRVLTSDGECIAGAYRRDDLPVGALVGLAVSAGTIEGRARVITDMAEADFEAGDILVTPFTDPSWTPLFLAIKGLVTEVGGLMTHGAVIAREYGLPAVVGVEHATRLIRDGQLIRVHGTDGYVEILA